MEVSKTIITALIVATLSSQNLSARNSPPSTVEVLVNYLIPLRVINATQEMKNLYPFITSSSYLQNAIIMLPKNINRQHCTSSQKLKDKLTIAYKKLSVFRRPLYMVFSYEENQGPLHSRLAEVLRDTSGYVNASIHLLSRQMREKNISLPADQPGSSGAHLNQYIRGFLEAAVNNTTVNLVITDDVVKRYRNYVIIYTLGDVIRDVATCVYVIKHRKNDSIAFW